MANSKSEGIEKALNEFTQKAFGRKRTATQCVMCGSRMVLPGDFKDSLSYREFGISRMCQKCQDKVFVKEEK